MTISSTAPSLSRRDPSEEAIVEAWWFVGVSLAFLFGGLLAAILPMLAAVPVTETVGWVLMLVGISQLLQTAMDRNWSGAVWQALCGAVFTMGGATLLVDPAMAPAAATIALATVAAATGAVQIVVAANYRPARAWSWMLVAGLCSLLAAVIIFASWPSEATWVKSIILGASLMITGGAYLLMAAAAQHTANDAAAHLAA